LDPKKKTVILIILIPIIPTMLILADCSKSKVVTVSSMQQDNFSLPQVNVAAFKGQGRLAFVWNNFLKISRVAGLVA